MRRVYAQSLEPVKTAGPPGEGRPWIAVFHDSNTRCLSADLPQHHAARDVCTALFNAPSKEA